MVCCLWQSLAEHIFVSMILESLERGPRQHCLCNNAPRFVVLAVTGECASKHILQQHLHT